MSQVYKHLFGPVPSRRLGRSLGVDLIPFKTCTLDCVYCQLGDTPCAISERGDYVPMAEVLDELDAWLKAGGEADHITLAGSGEPTLHTSFGDVFRWMRENTDIASVLLTNGTLLHLPEVREQATLADKVKVTLSAWNETSFQKMHRPAAGVTFDQLVLGERAFRQEFSGELSVEVFVVDGINSSPGDMRKIAEIVESISPDRIDLNTAVRPPADSGVKAVSPERLAELAEILGPKAEVTASFKKQNVSSSEVSDEALVGLIKRHPASGQQLGDEFGIAADAMDEKLKRLVDAGQLNKELRDGESYFFCRD